jgi:Macrocin-O-methyltransferase (TylF)
MSVMYSALNLLLNGVGLHLLRRSTLDQLTSSARNGHMIEPDTKPLPAPADDDPALDAPALDAPALDASALADPALDDPALRANAGAHDFRKIALAGEQMEQVPVSYLRNLQRESLALRDMSAELIKLKLQLAGATDGAGSGTSTDAEAGNHRLYTPVYDHWGLRTDPAIIHNHDFMQDPRFIAAYERGVAAEGYDPRYFWRTHVALWCASVAASLEGDFVECGVCRGMLSSSIMTYLDWNQIDRRFVLFDTFTGVDEEIVSAEEVASGNLGYFREMYKEDIYERVVRNFAEFKNVEIVRGSVPSTLSSVDIKAVAYLSIDMNNVTPEIAAINHFWDRLQPGAPVLLDDYGFVRYEAQKRGFDAWAAERGVSILALPTGQGLIIKPPTRA